MNQPTPTRDNRTSYKPLRLAPDLGKAALQKTGYTPKELADHLHIPEHQLTSYLTGEATPPLGVAVAISALAGRGINGIYV